MNREALPLILGLSIPIIAVALIVIYIMGVDYLSILLRVEPIYYIVLIPFVLGVAAAAMWLKKNPD